MTSLGELGEAVIGPAWPARLAVLLLAGALAACSPAPSPSPAPPAIAAAPSGAEPAKCRVGEGGAPPVAVQSADRGIGGTGISGGGPQLAERGIGGTGIIGVITGFASVCLNGVEVGLDRTAALEADGQDTAAADLRAGQLAVIEAAEGDTGLAARKVVIRHEVSGPVERVEAEPGGERRVLQVLGQQILIPGPVWGDRDVGVGDWVAVSGVRRFDGAVEATRLDRRAPGRILVRGRLIAQANAYAVGGLRVGAGFDLSRYVGQPVTLTGTYAPANIAETAGTLTVETVAPDLLAIDPVAYFGTGVQTFIVEDYLEVSGGRVRLAHGPVVGSGAAFEGREPGRAVLTFQRRGREGLTATALARTGRSADGWKPDSLNGRLLGGSQPLFSPPGSGPHAAAGPGRARDRSDGRASAREDRRLGSSGEGVPIRSQPGDGTTGQVPFPQSSFGPGNSPAPGSMLGSDGAGGGRPRAR